jgi:hypothetical protein
MLFSKDRMMLGEQRVLIRTEHKPISRLFHALVFILYPKFFLVFCVPQSAYCDSSVRCFCAFLFGVAV